MNLHAAYHFSAGDRAGFGDIVIEGIEKPPRCNADIDELKSWVRHLLIESNTVQPTTGDAVVTVVILGWTAMWPAEGGKP